jgi:hypothetical protein
MADKAQQTEVAADPAELAKWLVIGFKRCMAMHQVLAATGVSLPDDDSIAGAMRLHDAVPFMPADLWDYRTPVRAYVAKQWPKLAAYLDANAERPDKLISAIPQLLKLRARADSRAEPLTQAEYRDAAMTRTKVRRAATSFHAVREHRLSNQRGAWNVCKG